MQCCGGLCVHMLYAKRKSTFYYYYYGKVILNLSRKEFLQSFVYFLLIFSLYGIVLLYMPSFEIVFGFDKKQKRALFLKNTCNCTCNWFFFISRLDYSFSAFIRAFSLQTMHSSVLFRAL